MPSRRLVVKARKDDRCLWAWQGGYIEQGTFSGRPYYQRDTADGWDRYYLFYHSALKEWFFGESLPAGKRISYCTCSKGDAKSPETAVWDLSKVQEIVVKDDRGDDGEDGGLFRDPEFPHHVSSINRPGQTPIALAHGEPHWIPGRRLRRGEWLLFDGIEARDLLQGTVGDCWLLSAIAAMAEFPNEIRRVFLRDGLEKGDGRYVLRLFDHVKGAMREVTVDEYVPCHPKHWWHDEANPYFAQAHGNELWCLMLEKAMAKVIGSYGELNGGSCSSAFRSLTGMVEQIMWERKEGVAGWTRLTLCPDDVHKFQFPKRGGERMAPDNLFDHLRKCDEQNYLMAASIRGDGEPEHVRSDGLVEGHAYSVAQVHDIALSGRHLRLVELRNPWGGDKEWNGAWSDGDVAWARHPEVAKQLRPTFAHDGAFWMCWEDFSRVFTNVFICPKAMREGDDAIAHALATVDWKKYRPKSTRPAPPQPPSPPVPSMRLPWEAMTSVKAPPVVIEAPGDDADAADRRRSKVPEVGPAHVGGGGRRRWQVELKAGVWTDFPEDQQQIFALAEKQGKPSARFEARGQVYEVLFKECVQRNAKSGRDRPVRRAPGDAGGPEAAAEAGAAAFHKGDQVHVWSDSKSAWATDGVVVEVLAAPRAVDGQTLPPGSVQVCFEGGYAEKWLVPQQLAAKLRRAGGDGAGGKAAGATASKPAPFQPPPRR